MKFGKQHIHDLPTNDVTNLGALAQQLQREAQARGETLPPTMRLQIGEPNNKERISRILQWVATFFRQNGHFVRTLPYSLLI